MVLNPVLDAPKQLYAQGLSAHRQGDLEKAIALYRQAINLEPEWATLHYNVGVILDAQGQLEAAAQAYQRAIALVPDYRQAHENLGCVYLKQGKGDQAIQVLQHAIALHPQQASLLNNLGQAFQAQQQIDAAIDAYEQAIALQPDLAIAHINLGLVWQEQGDIGRAIAHFQTVLQFAPEHSIAHNHCAQLHFQQGNVGAAIQHWQILAEQNAHQLHPYCQHRHPAASTHEATIHSSESDLLQRSRTACSQFLEALLNHAPLSEAGQYLEQTYEALGDLLLSDGGHAQATYYFRQALRITPNRPSLLLKLGDCLALQQRFDAAISAYSIVTTDVDHAPHTYARLGKVLEQQQQFQVANTYYQLAIAHTDPILHPCPTRHGFSLTSHSNTSSNIGTSDDTHLHLRHSDTTESWFATTAIAHCHYHPIDWNSNPTVTSPSKPSPLVSPQQSSPQPYPEIQASTYPSHVPSTCGGVTCTSCMADLRLKFEPNQIQTNVYRCLAPRTIDLPPSPTFVATIPNGRAWVAPHVNDWSICSSIAVMTPDQHLLGDISRDYPWYLPGCRHPQRATHRVLQPHFSFPAIQPLKGRVALLSGLSGHVYYHWMVDILPRFGLLQAAGWHWDDIDAFVVNSLQQPFQREMLDILGIPHTKIIESDRFPYIQATELIVPSFPGHLDWIPPGTVQFLRSVFLTDRPTPVSPPPPLTHFPRYLYISRAKASYRRVLNEPEVIQALQPLGFVPITLETLSVSQQVELFAQAEVIVAPHGAGLTNTIFCQPGTHIVELASPHYVRTDYWIVSHEVGLSHYLVKGEGIDCSTLRQLMYQNPLTEDIWMPASTIQSMLAALNSIVHQTQANQTLGNQTGGER